MLLTFFVPLPLAPLFDLDEGAFSEATREMLVGKDYITTYLNGELRFDKPILIYWLQLISVKIFGLNEFALRLPSAIAATFWAGAIYYFTLRVLNKQTAFFATLFMIASLQINMIAKAAIADALLNLFIALSMFVLYYYHKYNNKKYLYLAFLFIGLGALTKGPVAIMIPLVVTFIFYLIQRKTVEWLKMVFNPIGLFIFAIIALPWYIAEYMAQGQAFIDGFFLKHNISRFNTSMESHGGTLFYFIPVLILGFMPFTYVAIKAIINVKNYFKDELKLYLIIWFLFVFIFFSLSGTKLPHYVIYGYTPLFILSALYLNQSVSKAWLIYPILTLLTLLLFLPEIATYLKNSITDELAQVIIANAYETFDLWYRLLIVGVMILLIIMIRFIKKTETLVTGVALAMIISVSFIVIPTYGKLMQLPIKEAALYAKEHKLKNIVMHQVNMPTFNVYYEGLVSKRAPVSGDIVFTKVPELKNFKHPTILYQKNGFTLIKLGDN
ncbi:MAG TPA: glycosyltransferase family 39 protein [Campylobacterales bacterium]|nr:glycosyltransferase family 39 protein [Campylobacterales bacterium]HHS92562.1 glycosyltransferase family 39 protein [Campylobacterales bacterium]